MSERRAPRCDWPIPLIRRTVSPIASIPFVGRTGSVASSAKTAIVHWMTSGPNVRSMNRSGRYSQRNVAPRGPRADAQIASSAATPRIRWSGRRAQGHSQRVGERRRRQRARDRGERRRQVVDRHDDPAEDEEARNRTFASASIVSARSSPGEQQPEAGERERSRAGPRRPRGPTRRPAGACQPSAERGDRDEQRDLDGLDDEDGRRSSRATSSAAAERRAAEALQDAVGAVVGGRDPEADEARRDRSRTRSSRAAGSRPAWSSRTGS